MQSNPKIAVVLPVYNGSRYLEGCIQSVLQQTFRDFEFFIRDDGSKDGSLAIAKKYAALDPRLKIIETQTKYNGLFHNLNELTRHVTAEYIHILCQDDELLPNCLQTEVDFLSTRPGIALAYSTPIIANEKLQEISRSNTNDLPERLRSRLALQQFYFHGCLPGNLSTVVFRRRFFEQAGKFDPSYTVAGDYEMWVRLCEKWDLGIINTHLVTLRRHGEQLSKSTTSLLPFYYECNQIRHRILARLPKEKAWDRWWYGQRFHRYQELLMMKEAFARGQYTIFFRLFLAIGPIVLFTAPVLHFLSTRVRALRPRDGFILSEEEMIEMDQVYAKYGRN